MSHFAQDFIELMRLDRLGGGALTQHLLREMAMSILAAGMLKGSDAVRETAQLPVHGQ